LRDFATELEQLYSDSPETQGISISS